MIKNPDGANIFFSYFEATSSLVQLPGADCWDGGPPGEHCSPGLLTHLIHRAICLIICAFYVHKAGRYSLLFNKAVDSGITSGIPEFL